MCLLSIQIRADRSDTGDDHDRESYLSLSSSCSFSPIFQVEKWERPGIYQGLLSSSPKIRSMKFLIFSIIRTRYIATSPIQLIQMALGGPLKWTPTLIGVVLNVFLIPVELTATAASSTSMLSCAVSFALLVKSVCPLKSLAFESRVRDSISHLVGRSVGPSP